MKQLVTAQEYLSRSKLSFYYSAIALIVITRFSFIFKGTYAFSDECRYYFSLQALDSLQKKDITGFFKYLSFTSGRPASAVINLVPASIQGILYYVYGLNPDTPTSYLVPVLFNCLVLLASMYLLYRIGLLVLHSQEVALTVVVVYSCLVNTNVYINHLLPYDLGIFITLVIIFRILLILRDNYAVTKIQAFQVGALAMFLLAEYPGYYMMVPIAGLMLVDWHNLFKRFQDHLIVTLFYAAGVLVVFGFFEGVARLGGVSYIESSSSLSETITQGSFEEGFSFIFKYLYQVEGFLGAIVVLCIIASFALVISYALKNSFRALWMQMTSNSVYILILFLSCGFIFHASLSYFMHKMVFYGRLIHPYILYIVLYCVGNALLKIRSYTTSICLVISILAIGSFIRFSVVFTGLEYPRDILYKYGVDTSAKNVNYKNEYFAPKGLLYKSPQVLKRGGNYVTYPGQVILVNYSFIAPEQDTTFRVYTPPANSKLLHEGPHFNAFPAYMFEGLNINQRAFVDKHSFKARLYIDK